MIFLFYDCVTLFDRQLGCSRQVAELPLLVQGQVEQPVANLQLRSPLPGLAVVGDGLVEVLVVAVHVDDLLLVFWHFAGTLQVKVEVLGYLYICIIKLGLTLTPACFVLFPFDDFDDLPKFSSR